MAEYSNERFAPVKEGDLVEVTIEGVGEKGDGIARVKGFVLFVANAKQGENVKVKVTRVLSKVGFAEVVGPAEGKPSRGGVPSARTAREETPKEEEVVPPSAEDTEDFGEETVEEDEEFA